MRWPLHHCNYEGVNGFRPASALVATRSRKFALGRHRGDRPGAAPGPSRGRPVGSPAVACVIAIDAGTTGVRALAVDEAGAVVDVSYRELTQHFPRPGWVEHDPTEIWECGGRRRWPRWPGASTTRAAPWPPSASPTSARRWWPGTAPRAVRCTAPSCGRTGARPSAATSCAPPATSPWSASAPGSSSTPTSRPPRWRGSSVRGGVEVTDDLVLGTVDAWLIWNLTGGTDGGVLATDATNASRTLALRHPRAGVVRRAVRHLRRAAPALCPRCAPRAGASAWWAAPWPGPGPRRSPASR